MLPELMSYCAGIECCYCDFYDDKNGCDFKRSPCSWDISEIERVVEQEFPPGSTEPPNSTAEPEQQVKPVICNQWNLGKACCWEDNVICGRGGACVSKRPTFA